MRSFLKRSNFIRSEKYCSLLEKLEARNLIALCDETISTWGQSCFPDGKRRKTKLEGKRWFKKKGSTGTSLEFTSKMSKPKTCDVLRWPIKVQWNPLNMTTFGPWKCGRNSRVVGLTMSMSLCGIRHTRLWRSPSIHHNLLLGLWQSPMTATHLFVFHPQPFFSMFNKVVNLRKLLKLSICSGPKKWLY